MKKFGLFLFLFFSFSFPTGMAKENFYGEKKITARIFFLNNGITTKNLDKKLKNITYTVKYSKIGIKLSYYDDTIIHQLENLSYYDFVTLEKDYKKILKQYGLYEDLEKVDFYGVPLKEIVIDTQKEDLKKIRSFSNRILLLS